MSTEKHTPTPWTASPDGSLIFAPEGYQCLRGQIAIAELRMTNRLSGGDAAFIVRACNSHEALAKELELADKMISILLNALTRESGSVTRLDVYTKLGAIHDGEGLIRSEERRAALKLAKEAI